MQKKVSKVEMSYTDKQRRLEMRRREQQTKPFQERYAKRSGMESTNSGLKRRRGLGELRVRGIKAMAHALYVRVAGWNLLQAVRSVGLMAKIRAILAGRGVLGRFWVRRLAWSRTHLASRATRPTKIAAIILTPAC